MSCFRIWFGLSCVALLAMASDANAQITYDASANWLATYPTTTALNSATHSTWGTANVWSRRHELQLRQHPDTADLQRSGL